jgi:protein-disulfide isomerase
VTIFTDYECPFCQASVPQSELALEMTRSKSSVPIEIDVRDFPLNPTCNPGALDLHPAACDAAAAVRLASARLGAADARALGLAFYHARQRLTPAFVLDQLRERGLDAAFTQQRGTLLAGIARDARSASALRVHSTPTVFVNGIRLDSIMLLKRVIARETARLAPPARG